MDLRKIARQLQQNQTDRAIARALGVDRKTVGHYRTWGEYNRQRHDRAGPVARLSAFDPGDQVPGGDGSALRRCRARSG